MKSRGAILNSRRIHQVIAFRSLLGVFPKHGTPTDVDFLVEIGCHYLIGEFKKSGNEIPDGQRLAIERLIRKLGIGSFAFLAHHDSTEPIVPVEACIVTRLFDFKEPGAPKWRPCDFSVWEICDKWRRELPLPKE